MLIVTMSCFDTMIRISEGKFCVYMISKEFELLHVLRNHYKV